MVTSESVLGVKPHDSGVVKRYQVGLLTYDQWEHSIPWSHIYLGFKGKVSTLTHFLLEPSCEDCSFLVQTVQDFEHSLE